MDIFKLLPRTNCRDCQSPSCLAFAMKIAAGKGDFRQCPHLSPESEAKLSELMEPPVRSVELERGDQKALMGGEKVIFRHDETFYNPPPIFIEVPDNLSEEALREKTDRVSGLIFERVGQIIKVEGIAVVDRGNPDFAGYVELIQSKSAGFTAVETYNGTTIRKILKNSAGKGTILLTSREIVSENASLIESSGTVASIRARSLIEAEDAGSFLKGCNIKRGIIAVEGDSSGETLNILYNARVMALTRGRRNLGYPFMAWNSRGGSAFDAAGAVLKYASAIVTTDDNPAVILPLLTLRQNIYTDPRRPIQVEAKLYPFGDVSPDSPVLVTTNFSLTYFTVSSEIESARVPAYLVIVDTDGTSVLTAWSADRFNRKNILNALEKTEVFKKVNHRQLIIPGYVSMMKEELEEDTGLTVTPGPREASGLPDFLRRRYSTGNI